MPMRRRSFQTDPMSGSALAERSPRPRQPGGGCCGRVVRLHRGPRPRGGGCCGGRAEPKRVPHVLGQWRALAVQGIDSQVRQLQTGIVGRASHRVHGLRSRSADDPAAGGSAPQPIDGSEQAHTSRNGNRRVIRACIGGFQSRPAGTLAATPAGRGPFGARASALAARQYDPPVERTQRRHVLALGAGVIVLTAVASGPAVADGIQVHMEGGRVTLVATAAPLTEVLAAWSRVPLAKRWGVRRASGEMRRCGRWWTLTRGTRLLSRWRGHCIRPRPDVGSRQRWRGHDTLGASCENHVQPSLCLRRRGERGAADGARRLQDESDRDGRAARRRPDCSAARVRVLPGAEADAPAPGAATSRVASSSSSR